MVECPLNQATPTERTAMRLSELATRLSGVRLMGAGDPDILGLGADSREIGPGFLFAALPGRKGDGGDFVADAVARGAAAVLAASPPEADPGVPVLVADKARRAFGEAADIFYGHPARSLELVGITGTNGKTTTAYLLRHILNGNGRAAGMLGTIEYDLGGRVEAAPLTTPDAARFTRSLAAMRDAGLRYAVAEVSSHALDQERVWPHRFAVALFTNLTRDHLDYHPGMEAYFQAKRRLFLGLDARAAAVVNARDPWSERITAGTRARVEPFLLADESGRPGLPAGTLAGTIVRSDLAGQGFVVRKEGMEWELSTPLVGRHNVENCLGAIAAARALGVDMETIATAMASFSGVPGRLERLESPDGLYAFVDYAHTDDALRSVLAVLRPLVPGRLVTVFGCGGDRDPGKRPLMAAAAEEFSDLVVATSDNPRSEDPDAILDAVMAGFRNPAIVRREVERPRAVELAVSLAGPGDAVLVAGKGHEDYQIVGREKRHMDDRELLRDAFRKREAGGG